MKLKCKFKEKESSNSNKESNNSINNINKDIELISENKYYYNDANSML